MATAGWHIDQFSSYSFRICAASSAAVVGLGLARRSIGWWHSHGFRSHIRPLPASNSVAAVSWWFVRFLSVIALESGFGPG